jgi:purine-binding chemotaxis protein CheW
MGEDGGRGRRAILVFEVGGRRFGLPVADVRELLRAVTILPLPLAPDVVEGAINLRGVVAPVLDLRARLRLPPKAAEPSDHLIVVERQGRPVVLRIDRALFLARLDEAQIGQAGGLAPGGDDVAEVATLPDGLVPVLDLRAVLMPDEAAAIGKLPEVLEPSATAGEGQWS